jgi:hypothetical protein
LTSVVSGPPKVPTEAERLMLPADWALRSCLSFPSGSPVVETDVRLKSIFAAASAETFGWAGEALDARRRFPAALRQPGQGWWRGQ